MEAVWPGAIDLDHFKRINDLHAMPPAIFRSCMHLLALPRPACARAMYWPGMAERNLCCCYLIATPSAWTSCCERLPAFTEVQLIGLNVPDLSHPGRSAGLPVMSSTTPCNNTRRCTGPSAMAAIACAAAWETSMPELTVGERQWTVAAGSNLLDALNQQGLQVPYSCRACCAATRAWCSACAGRSATVARTP